MSSSEAPEYPAGPDNPDEGFETGPAIESDDQPPSEGFSTPSDMRGDDSPPASDARREGNGESLPSEDGEPGEGFGTGIETAVDRPPDEGFVTEHDVKAPGKDDFEVLGAGGFKIERQS